MMKRRNCLICSIIAMLSIVSYACETEYAICEGCGTSEDGDNSSENVCNGNIKCAENLNGKQVRKGGEWGNDGACNYCFNENTSNGGVKEVGCSGCTPNSYHKSGAEVCYKGDFKKFESKSDSDSNLGVVKNTDPKSDDAPWEFAYNNSGSLKYYNCHNGSVFERIKEDLGGGRIDSCCKENDYYIKHIGYKYYSVEVCRKVVFKEGTKPGFWAYEYTGELNDSLIGQKQKLPYGFCYNDDIFLAVDNVVEGKSVFHRYQCGSGRECNDGFNGLCIINGVSIDENKAFKCANPDDKNKVDAVFIKYETDNKPIATCPAGTELKIKVDNGTWSNVDCTKRIFKLDKVRCAPIELSNDGFTPIPKS